MDSETSTEDDLISSQDFETAEFARQVGEKVWIVSGGVIIVVMLCNLLYSEGSATFKMCEAAMASEELLEKMVDERVARRPVGFVKGLLAVITLGSC